MATGALGKYQLGTLISKGGMGELYRARSQGPGGYDREVALKIVRPDLAPDDKEHFAELFIEEAKTLASLSHGNLIHIYDFGEDQGTLYMSMELVHGRDLSKINAAVYKLRAGLLGVRYVLRIIEQVAQGLDYAHRLVVDGKRLEMVHRDVSPSNILVSFDGAVKLADFGVARIQRANPLTQSGVVKGKTGYMAPEYLATQQADSRADVFALGVVLWEALTGQRLFADRDAGERREHILHGAINPPSCHNPAVGRPLDEIVLRALERDPKKRFQSARDLAMSLRDFAQQNQLVADEVDLGKELRRLFPNDVPSTGMDLRGLTKLTPIAALQPAPQAPQAELESTVNGRQPALTVDSGDIIQEPSSTGSTAPKITQALSAQRAILDGPADLAEVPSVTEVPSPTEMASVTEVPTLPEFQQPVATEPAVPIPAAPAKRQRRWQPAAAISVGIALLAGGYAWWPSNPRVPRPIEDPPTSATTPTVTPTPTPIAASQAQVHETPSPLPGERAGVRGPPNPIVPSSPHPPPTSNPIVPSSPLPPPTSNPLVPSRPHPRPTSNPLVPSSPQSGRIEERPSPTRAAFPPPHTSHHHLKPGTLAVIAIRPWVQVFVDGVSRGYSPAPAISVPAGRHKITLSNDELHITRTFSVVVPEAGRIVFRGDAKTVQPLATDE